MPLKIILAIPLALARKLLKLCKEYFVNMCATMETEFMFEHPFAFFYL